MARIGDFASATVPIGPATPGAEVFDRFQSEPDTLVIAVIDSDQRPVGLIERNVFTLKMAAEFGRALYAKRPAEAFMDAAPRILDADADAETLFQSMDEGNLGGLLNGFVVTSEGRYVGVGAGVHVLQAGNAIHRRRADAMGVLASDLVRAEAEARASSRAKSEFLAVMSHEIRTPLNGVLGVAALMERELTQEGMRPYVQTILDSGQSLLHLLTDALDMSRAEAGLMTFETAPIDLDSVATDLKALWSPRAEEKNLILTVTRDTIGRDWVAGDEVRLKQLFNNLIGNALKFTEAGEVAVHISSRETDGQIALTATVDDSGPGIPEDLVGTIFEPFNTGHAGREGAGAGLGLAICRQIVERMNGNIAVERSPQGGARFRFALTLPGASPEMQAAAVQMARPTLAATLHVLIVDDNATNRFVAAKVLELFGCNTEAVEGGREAVDHVQTGAFDLILMDIKMLGMDGVQATRLIRGLSGPVARIPILALTANADPVDEVKYLEAGMDGVAQKPIQPDALLNAIHLVMDRASAQTTAVTEAA